MAYQPQEPAAFQAYLTTATLGIGGIYQSGVLDLQGFTQVDTHIMSDVAGTITVRWYDDPGGLLADQVRILTIPYGGGSEFQLFSAPAFTPYVQYEYTNGSGIQTKFFYETKFLHTSLSPQILGLDAFIAGGMVSVLNRSILVAQNDAGSWNNVKSDNQQHLEVNVSNPKTAYDELAVANLTPITQVSFAYNINSDIVSTTEVAGGTVTQADNMAVLNTSATTGSSAVLESIKKIPYRAGQGHIARFACLFTGTPTVATAYLGIGVGDASDGYGFLLDSSGFNISYRTNTTQTSILQTAWNVDRLDGTLGSLNPSGMTLDITKGNSYQIAYGSGFGTINFSIESDVSGDYVLVHTLALANTLTVPSAYNPTLAMRAEAGNGAGTDDLTISVSSMSSFVEGLNKPTGPQNAVDGSITATTTEEPILSVRGRATFGGKTNKVDALIKFISLNNDANGAGTFRLRREATFTGAPTFVDVGTNTSVIETTALAGGANGTMTAGTGTLIWAGQVGKDKGDNLVVDNLDLRILPGELLTLTIELVSGGGVNAGTIVWQEDF